MRCLGILWSSAYHLKEQVTVDLANYGQILAMLDLDLDGNYENFVRDIYAQDNIAEWKVNKKIETMNQCSENKSVVVFILEVDIDKIEYHPLKKRDVFVNVESMKTNIREKYKNLVPVYFFDNIFHVTDDEIEFYNDLDVVQKYIYELGAVTRKRKKDVEK